MKKDQVEMPFLAHLEQLRWHLIRAFLSISIVAIGIFIYRKFIYEHFLLAHLDSSFPTYTWICKTANKIGFESDFCFISYKNSLQSLSPSDQIMNLMWTCLILGFIIAFPYILWEFWSFISPGLTKKERNKSRFFIATASFLFFLGVLFSYYVIAPLSVYFFYNFQITNIITNQFDFKKHVNLITNSILCISIMFELPILIYFLSKMNLVTPEFLIKHRKVALILVLVLSAVITPPDVASQIIVSIPIFILYELSIYISKYVHSKDNKSFKNQIQK